MKALHLLLLLWFSLGVLASSDMEETRLKLVRELQVQQLNKMRRVKRVEQQKLQQQDYELKPQPAPPKNYLISLSRSISSADVDSILDLLLKHNALVKRIYDYKVFKGILFTSPSPHLSTWKKLLSGTSDVISLEEDAMLN